jgi:NADH dehydrogenase FAD-containing subunit
VTGVERDFIKIKAKDSEEVQNVPYGLCVWSTGAARPLLCTVVGFFVATLTLAGCM